MAKIEIFSKMIEINGKIIFDSDFCVLKYLI